MLVYMGHMMIYLLGCTITFMRYIIDVHLYDVVMYFHDIYFLLMMFVSVQYKQWDLALHGFISLGVADQLVVWERKPTFSCLSSSMQSSVLVSYVGYLFRDGFNFHMLGVHGISSYTFNTMHVSLSYGTLGWFWSHWFQFWVQQAALEIDSLLEKKIVIRVVKQQEWWFLSEIFLEC